MTVAIYPSFCPLPGCNAKIVLPVQGEVMTGHPDACTHVLLGEWGRGRAVPRSEWDQHAGPSGMFTCPTHGRIVTKRDQARPP